MPKGIYIRTKPIIRTKPAWNKGKKGLQIAWNKGLKVQTNTGRTHFKKGFTPWNKDKKRPEISGNKHPNWRGGKKLAEERNREWKQVYTLNRYAQKIAMGSYTFGEWELLKKQYNHTCLSCLKKEPEIKLSQDHIIPLSKGGSNNIENIQPLCFSCNSRKYTKTIDYR